MKNKTIRKLSLVSLLLLIFLNACFLLPTSFSENIPITSANNDSDEIKSTSTIIYLPIITKPAKNFFGIYLKQYWTQDSVSEYLPYADQIAGKKHSSVGWFIDLEDDAFTIPVMVLEHNNLYRQLEVLWNSGYVSFINLGSNATAAQIINGERDQNIEYAAEFYKNWIDLGGNRKAMIAPLQEMNGDWTVYGENSTSDEYKLAYRHIVGIFDQKGIDRSDVWWVFAPNAWNDPMQPNREFENYYPGDDVVDLVGFSSYNYGYCPSTADISARWESYEQIFDPYITRMEIMSPSKPIIIAETATTAYYNFNQQDNEHKNQWLVENYNYLAEHPSVVGVFYFSFSEFDGYACDFEIFSANNSYSGYKEGLANPIYKYLTIDELNSLLN